MTWKRIATAAVLIPAVVAIVLWGSTAVLALGLALVMLLALFEFFALGDAIGHRAYRFWSAACALLLVFVQWWTANLHFQLSLLGREQRGWPIIESLRGAPGLVLALPPNVGDVFFVFLLGAAVITLWTRRPMVEALPAAGISSSGLLFVALPLTFAIRLHGIEFLGPRLLLFVLVITWVGDSAAYFAGRTLGGPKLAPLLSPKKTWAGSIASVLGALLVALVSPRWLDIELPHLLAIAVVANAAGQLGDLLESAFKRSAGVKDSGTLLPGHGGVLDRIDALILVFPVVWYYWIWIYFPKHLPAF